MHMTLTVRAMVIFESLGRFPSGLLLLPVKLAINDGSCMLDLDIVVDIVGVVNIVEVSEFDAVDRGTVRVGDVVRLVDVVVEHEGPRLMASMAHRCLLKSGGPGSIIERNPNLKKLTTVCATI